MNRLNIQGFFLVNACVSSLNNAGADKDSNMENAVATKKIMDNGKWFVYVSAQAWKSWLRETLQKNFDQWRVSPVTTEKKIAFTDANPLNFNDDDFFGYMKATKEEVKKEDSADEEANPTAEEGNGKGKKAGKVEKKDVTVTRKSPFNASALISVVPIIPARTWSSMSRKTGNSIPYVKEEYSGPLKGQFSIALNQVGYYSSYYKAGFRNITEEMAEEYLKNGCTQQDDPYVKLDNRQPAKLVVAPLEQRQYTATEPIKALKILSGGAMQANNMTDVTPQFIILALTTSANHPFGNIMKVLRPMQVVEEPSEGEGDAKEINVKYHGGKAEFHIAAIEEVINEYRNYFKFPIHIGKKLGYMDEQNDDLQKLAEKYPKEIVYGPVNSIIDKFCDFTKTQMS